MEYPQVIDEPCENVKVMGNISVMTFTFSDISLSEVNETTNLTSLASHTSLRKHLKPPKKSETKNHIMHGAKQFCDCVRTRP